MNNEEKQYHPESAEGKAIARLAEIEAGEEVEWVLRVDPEQDTDLEQFMDLEQLDEDFNKPE